MWRELHKKSLKINNSPPQFRVHFLTYIFCLIISTMKSLNSYLKQLDMSVLVDMLSAFTNNYTKLFVKKDMGEEFEEIKSSIKIIQREIYRRIYIRSTLDN